MKDQKKSVHKTGALGALLASGQIAKVQDHLNENTGYATDSGIKFTEDEFMYVDPSECEPWEYANRHKNDFGDIEELKKSIQEQSQLQPVLIRDHVNPHDGIKYEVIFGCRRHRVCKELDLKMMAIRKKTLSLKEALKYQHIENEQRKNVSNYSNALIFKRLLDDKIYRTQKELASSMGLPSSTLHEYMYYTKIDNELLVQMGANIHLLSKYLVKKIIMICEEDPLCKQYLISIADKFGDKIKTPAQLSSELNKLKKDKTLEQKPIYLVDAKGAMILELKKDHKGKITINFSKTALNDENCEALFAHLREFYTDSEVVLD
ncbi:MAG: ParB/RepB/Spo0J family partition protein [Rickettsiaceae bacterium]|nr:ParB/RepB/Spo0J family partition protein [Rickettsiaceae bacterium]